MNKLEYELKLVKDNISDLQESLDKAIHYSSDLQRMFDKQKVLQKRLFDIDLPQMMPERLPMAITSIIAELGEVLEEQQGWKDWKKHPKPVNKENLDTEIADIWHFVINLTLYLGYDAKELMDCFMKKNATNHVRQDNNY